MNIANEVVVDQGRVESLNIGKSMESVKSMTISDVDEQSTVAEEKWYTFAIQVFIPFMIAGVGTIGAGIVLGEVEVGT